MNKAHRPSTEFEATYSRMADDELMNVARDQSVLVAPAKDALERELRKRNIGDAAVLAYSQDIKSPHKPTSRGTVWVIRIGAVVLFFIGVSKVYRAILLADAASSDEWSRKHLLGVQIALWFGFGVLCLAGYGLFRLRKWAYWVFLCVVLPLALLGPLWSLLLYLIFAACLYSGRGEFQ